MDQLNKNGFLVLKNVLNMNRVNYAKELINNKVNYFRLKDFLDNDMINTVNNVLNLNIDYILYRVSNNNNLRCLVFIEIFSFIHSNQQSIYSSCLFR